MSEPVTIMNNFPKLKGEFKTDTGLDADKHIEAYISYFNARMNDKTYQTVHLLTHQLLNKIDHLPDSIRLRIAEMITTHPIIKELVKK